MSSPGGPARSRSLTTIVDPSVPTYGLDIETDTACDGLDPRVATIVAVAVSGDDDEVVFTDGDERALLAAVDEDLARRRPGVIVTWNGACFDLPFLASRSAAVGLELGLRLRLDPTLPFRTALPGHEGAYRASWHGHRHLDAYRVWRNDLHRVVDVSCSLKSVARLTGHVPVEVDRERVHELSPTALHEYVVSDARLARLLALRRWSTATPFVDGDLDDAAAVA
ncbi:MAG: ribonuclease H-like domain-containing protein [Actinomycetota bacterium]